MKIFFFFPLLVMLAFASLEPSGYRPSNSGIPSNRYLPPTNNDDGSSTVLTPESHYLSTSYQNPTSPNVIPNSQYLPSNRDSVLPHGTPIIVAMPSVKYLPTVSNQPLHSTPSVTSTSITNQYHHDRHDNINAVKNSLTGQRVQSLSTSTISSPIPLHTAIKSDIVPSRYIPPSQRPGTFTQAIPSSTYLPDNHNQYSNEIEQPSASVKPPFSNVYLVPNKFSNPFSRSTVMSQDHFNSYSNADSFDQSARLYDPANGGYTDGFSGYDRGSDIAKYEFEYAVKDEFGNDYSHKESHNDDNTQGIYTVLLPDGRKQIVRYTANSDGYKPSITYEDTATSQSGYDEGYKY